METIIFFKWLGLTTLTLFLILGVAYWIKMAVTKICPNWKFWIKYKLFRRKFNKKDVEKLLQYLDAGMNKDDVLKFILLNSREKNPMKQAKEVLYIYSEMQKIERRNKNE